MGLFILSILVEICLQVPLSGMSLCLLTPLSMSNLSVLKLSNLVSLLSIWLQFLVLMLDMHDTHDMPFSKYIKIGFILNPTPVSPTAYYQSREVYLELLIKFSLKDSTK